MKFYRAIGVLVFAAFALLARGDVKMAIAPQAQPFPLAQVRLFDSPFRDAMVRDENYLLRLEPDRLLSWFRKEAGLQPKGGSLWRLGIARHRRSHARPLSFSLLANVCVHRRPTI